VEVELSSKWFRVGSNKFCSGSPFLSDFHQSIQSQRISTTTTKEISIVTSSKRSSKERTKSFMNSEVQNPKKESLANEDTEFLPSKAFFLDTTTIDIEYHFAWDNEVYFILKPALVRFHPFKISSLIRTKTQEQTFSRTGKLTFSQITLTNEEDNTSNGDSFIGQHRCVVLPSLKCVLRILTLFACFSPPIDLL